MKTVHSEPEARIGKSKGQQMTGDCGDGGPPVSGWAKLVAELPVRDIGTSSTFWQSMLGFRIAYKRSEQHFVYLEHPEGA